MTAPFAVEPGRNSVYELQAYPGDFERYNGKLRASSVYVIGYGTEHEQIFRKADQRLALKTARELKVTIFQAPANQICAAAIEDLYDAA